MVLCAGMGTRLRPLTEELPKPLVPIGDRSILAHAATALAGLGLGEVVINTHWLPEVFPAAIRGLPLRARVVHEASLLGTAGGVAGARRWLGPPPVVVWNGDILVEPPLQELLQWGGDGLCLAVAQRARGLGTVGCDGEGRVVRLRGEIFAEEAFGADYVGVAALGARCLAQLPPVGCLIGDYALPELRRGGSVATTLATGWWVDAGAPAAYLAANLEWLVRRGDARWIGPGAWIAPGVRVEQSIVGVGARVGGRGELLRCVVWPHAEAVAPLSDSIVTGRGRVVSTR